MTFMETEYHRVIDPENCKRIGTEKLGGHCLVCGFDMFPWSGAEIEPGYIIHYEKCYKEYFNTIKCSRDHFKTLPARHLSSFGDHACY